MSNKTKIIIYLGLMIGLILLLSQYAGSVKDIPKDNDREFCLTVHQNTEAKDLPAKCLKYF